MVNVKGCDAVTLFSTETDRYLSLHERRHFEQLPKHDFMDDLNRQYEVSLRAVEGAKGSEIIDTSVFWRIELVQRNGEKAEEPGGDVTMSKNSCLVRLCHLHTGLYIAIKETD